MLDNVLTLTARDIIAFALPCNTLGSRVIVTTSENFRKLNLKNCWHWNNHSYSMNSLWYDDDCDQLLFHRRVFGSTGSCPPELVDIYRKILSECSGVPLALTLISGLLANKPCTRTIWEQVCDLIATGNHDGKDKGLRNILLLCYHGLPHYLKTCLLHLNVFPENHLIDRDRVVRCWIAEGFVLEKHGRTLEEEGQGYFSDLVQRGLIQPARGSSYDGEPEAFLVYRMVLDLVRSKLVRDNCHCIRQQKGLSFVKTKA